MLIDPLLIHRADVLREISKDFDGQIRKIWSKVFEIRCLFTVPEELVLADPTRTPEQLARAATMGQLLVSPKTPLLPLDRLTFTRPATGFNKATVAAKGTPVPGPGGGVSHLLYHVNWLV